ncbi:MAG TPA: glycerol-3-phosphate responsive antiterminator, partial [Desulfitobacteriaceae bacterium]|nr:glycerol-3-phosphate responsive antiterminator [Desulfitobacteriaceae bacterium]
KTVLAACDGNNLNQALQSDAASIILLNANINLLLSREYKENCRRKPIFIHFDLLKGLSDDKESLRFLKKYVNPFGIVTTKNIVARSAKKEGLTIIQRIFLIDTTSFKKSLEAIAENKPDAVEIMPAIAPSIVKRYKEHVNVPIILGGLISQESQIAEAFKNEADAVSLSKSELWNYKQIAEG